MDNLENKESRTTTLKGFKEEIEQMKKQKQRDKKILEMYRVIERQSDTLYDFATYVSLFPRANTEKATDYPFITRGISRQPVILSMKELKKEVAVKGKTFCGSIFLDLDHYKKRYGKCTANEISSEWVGAWEYLYQRAIGIPGLYMTGDASAGGNVTTKKEHFILMSTFRFRRRQ